MQLSKIPDVGRLGLKTGPLSSLLKLRMFVYKCEILVLVESFAKIIYVH